MYYMSSMQMDHDLSLLYTYNALKPMTKNVPESLFQNRVCQKRVSQFQPFAYYLHGPLDPSQCETGRHSVERILPPGGTVSLPTNSLQVRARKWLTLTHRLPVQPRSTFIFSVY